MQYYLTMWYTRDEIQFRQALFFSAASVAGAFSGLLAFAIGKMDGKGGLEGWRWIFILEGIATVLVAVFAYFALYDFPETAGFLTEEERAFVVFRLKYQGQRQLAASNSTNKKILSSSGEEGGTSSPVPVARPRVAQAEEFRWEYVWQAFKDWQIWVNIFVYWGVSFFSSWRCNLFWLMSANVPYFIQIVCPLYGISLFLPTIIRNLNYTSSTAQLMTVPIYITAAILAVIVAWISDRVGKRSPFIIGFLFVMLVGFSMSVFVLVGTFCGSGNIFRLS